MLNQICVIKQGDGNENWILTLTERVKKYMQIFVWKSGGNKQFGNLMRMRRAVLKYS
jgi:hypothetical protein